MWATNSPQIKKNSLKQHGCVSSSLDHILEADSNRSTCLSNVSLSNWWTSRSGSGIKTVWPKAITLHPSNGKKIQTSNMQRPKRQECRLAHQMGARRPGRPTSGNAELLHAFAGPACSYLWYINCNLGCMPNWMHLLDLFLPLIWYWLQVCILGKIWYAYFVHKIYI